MISEIFYKFKPIFIGHGSRSSHGLVSKASPSHWAPNIPDSDVMAGLLIFRKQFFTALSPHVTRQSPQTHSDQVQLAGIIIEKRLDRMNRIG